MLRFTLLIAFFVLQSGLSAQCRIAEIVAQHKMHFEKPYKYDGFNYFKMEFGDSAKTINKEFIAFKGQKYQLMFCTSGFEEIVRINIYNADDNSLIAGTTVGADINRWSFFCTKTGTYKIEYLIPPSETGFPHDGCIAMMIGFSEK